MAVATPNPSNDAALNAQLDITRDASIANLEQKSEETRQQYRDEAAQIADQKQRSAEVVQGTINAARDNNAVQTEAQYQQALKNAETAVNSWQHRGLNHLSQDTPGQVHANIIRTGQELLNAQEAFLAYHPEERNNPAYQLHLAEDETGNFSMQTGPQAELAEQTAIASIDDARNMPLDDLRKVVQRPNRRQANPNENLVTFIDHPEDGTFDAKLVTGEIFTGFKANENRDAIRKIAESKVNTRRHYEALAQQQPANGPQTQPQPQAQPANDPAVNANQSLTNWFLDETAKQFGYTNGAEFVADQKARYQREQQNNVLLDQYKNQTTVSEFFLHHPEYPNTDAANDALEQIIVRNNWEWTPETMAAAHALAVQKSIYQPLTQEEIALSAGYAAPAQRQAPPPMLPSSNPENTRPPGNEWEIPLDQLRKQALGLPGGGR